MNIKQYRISMGLTQQEAAKEIGCTRSWFNQLETGKMEPSLRMAKQIQSWSDGKISAVALLGITESHDG